jgi:pimeloyl-ACP methyl ester carboxylesterase
MRKCRSGYAISPADGSPLFYEIDTPERPIATVVLNDGIGCDGYVWKYLRRDLPDDLRVVHWHYPGHGRSPLPRARPNLGIPDLADDAMAVLDDADVDQAILFGHSMGVQVVLETYRRHAERIDAMVLMCGMPEKPLKTFKGTDKFERVLPVVRSTVNRAPRVFNRLARMMLPTRLSYTLAQVVEVNGQLLDMADFMPYLHGLSRVQPHWFLSLLAAAGLHSATDLLPNIAVPTLIVAGDRDGFTPAHLSEAMAAAIPGSELVVIEGGTHTAPLERPELVDQAVTDFLERRVTTREPSETRRAES